MKRNFSNLEAADSESVSHLATSLDHLNKHLATSLDHLKKHCPDTEHTLLTSNSHIIDSQPQNVVIRDVSGDVSEDIGEAFHDDHFSDVRSLNQSAEQPSDALMDLSAVLANNQSTQDTADHSISQFISQPTNQSTNQSFLDTAKHNLDQLDLSFELPADRLVPPVPSRLDYLITLRRLLNEFGIESDDLPSNVLKYLSTNQSNNESNNQSTQPAVKQTDNVLDIHGPPVIRVLDIGVGCNAIFSLLGGVLGWKMVGTDIDPVALEWAKQNLSNNQTNNRTIDLRHQPDSSKVFTNVLKSSDRFSACVCNPPFYPINQSINQRHPDRDWPMVSSESECENGEKGFVERMLMESIDFKQRIEFFTCMLSSKKNAKKCHTFAQSLQPACKLIRLSEFGVGKYTRWILIWSWSTRCVNSVT